LLVLLRSSEDLHFRVPFACNSSFASTQRTSLCGAQSRPTRCYQCLGSSISISYGSDGRRAHILGDWVKRAMNFLGACCEIFGGCPSPLRFVQRVGGWFSPGVSVLVVMGRESTLCPKT
jgi:hypothetical protein